MIRRRLVDQVIEELQQRISLGALAPGERMPTEDQLTAQLGVSRTTLREAVGVLTHAGLIDVRQGDGSYVCAVPATAEPLDRRLRRAAAAEVYEVRRALEVEAARLAAARRTTEDLAHMRAHLAADADVALHVAIARASRNAVLADLFATFADVARDPTLREDTTALHHQLVDAIARRDADAAVAATRLLHLHQQ